jgi:hypothetical protein
MRDKLLRVRIPSDLLKEYKKLCVELELSLPAQTEQLITHFVSITKQNQIHMMAKDATLKS